MYLHFAEFERGCDLRSLREAKILLGMELPFEFEQLFAGEGGSPSSSFAPTGPVVTPMGRRACDAATAAAAAGLVAAVHTLAIAWNKQKNKMISR